MPCRIHIDAQPFASSNMGKALDAELARVGFSTKPGGAGAPSVSRATQDGRKLAYGLLNGLESAVSVNGRFIAAGQASIAITGSSPPPGRVSLLERAASFHRNPLHTLWWNTRTSLREATRTLKLRSSLCQTFGGRKWRANCLLISVGRQYAACQVWKAFQSSWLCSRLTRRRVVAAGIQCDVFLTESEAMMTGKMMQSASIHLGARRACFLTPRTHGLMPSVRSTRSSETKSTS
jgi:hypothetical protein